MSKTTKKPAKLSMGGVRHLIKETTGVAVNPDSTVTEYIQGLTDEDFAKMPNFDRTWDLGDIKIRRSALWVNLIWKIGKEYNIIQNYSSVYMRFMVTQETGGIIEEIHTNPRRSLNRNRLTGSSVLDVWFDDIETAYYTLNRQRVIPGSVKRAEALKIMSSWESINSFLNSLIELDETSFHVEFTEVIEQMLANYYLLNKIPIIRLTEHPTDSENASKSFIAIMLAIATKFTSRMTTDYSIANRSRFYVDNPDPQIPEQRKKRKVISARPPVYLLKDQHVKWAQVADAFTLIFGVNFVNGDSNNEWQRNLLALPVDFPDTIKSLEIDYTMSQEEIDELNSLEVINARQQGYTGELARPDDELIGFCMDELAFLLESQFDQRLDWENIMTMVFTTARHFDHWNHLGAFRNIVAFTSPKAQNPLINLDVQD